MAGIYLHIPFCKQACHYCDFHFSTSLDKKVVLLAALHQEIALQKMYLNGAMVNTIYFGGGTPSILEVEELQQLIGELAKHHPIADDVEITLEANPDDLTREKVAQLRKSPINRLSIGIQSFHEADLKWMNRAHTASQAHDCVKRAQDAGVTNISIDLIYGTPGLTDGLWKDNLHKAFELQVPHISSYCLTIEPRTALADFVKKGKSAGVDEAQSARQFEILMDEMQAQEYIHYEISNFCKEGKYSKHNTNYWTGEHYLGIGPSAHSFNGNTRQWNIANNAQYILALNKGTIPAEAEELGLKERYNEYVMTSLRTIWGCNTEWVKANIGADYSEHLMHEAQRYVDDQHLQLQNDVLTLSHSGKLIADRIASDLFW
jgi:oxygen-independent coproporphyrinogen-3 oxidase